MLVSVPRDAVTVSVGLMTIQNIRSSTPDLHLAVQCQPTEETGPMLLSYSGLQRITLLTIRDECGFSLECSNLGTTEQLTYEELNTLRYTAGYVPRALQKKLSKISHPRQKDLLLYLNERISDGSEPVADSSDWITIVNREGLVMVNNMAFELFYALEIEFRRLIQPKGISDNAVQLLSNDEDVLFLWSIISSSWDSDCNSELLERIVKLWVTLRGFSLCGA
eukprot:Em0081g1a